MESFDNKKDLRGKTEYSKKKCYKRSLTNEDEIYIK